MHIYNNLNDKVKRIFRYRILYIAFLTLFNLYSIIVLAIGAIGYSSSRCLIAMIVINFILIINGMMHIWYLIDTNDTSYWNHNNFENKEDCIQMIDGLIGVSMTYVDVIVYCFLILTNDITLV